MSDLRRISNSELRTWKRCRRKWYLTYYRRLKLRRENPTGAAPIGTRVHAILQDYYNCKRTGLSPDHLMLHDALVEADVKNFPEDEAAIRKEADLTRAMLEGYFQWLEETGADEGLRIISAEKKLEAEVAGVILQGKLDVRVQRDTDGAIEVIDHKTCQDFSIAHGLARDEQIKTYLLLERLCRDEFPVDGAIYNMLRKVKRTASAKPPFYDRAEIRHNEHVLRDFYFRVVAEIQDIVAAERELKRGRQDTHSMYPNPTKDCKWECPFVGVCALMDDPTASAEQLIEALYEEGDPYQRYLDAGE